MKKKIKNIFLFSLVCLYSKGVFSQTTGPNIGNRIPDFTLTPIIHFEKANAKISDFKGKLLILDLWATWCGPCIGMFPKTDSLQKAFAGKLQFMPVTYEDENTVEKFYSGFKKRRGIDFPTVISDTAINHYFFHKAIPQYIWINGEGIIIAITGTDEINSVNIRNAISGLALNLPVKADNHKTVDGETDFFQTHVMVLEDEKVHPEPIDLNTLLFTSTLTRSMFGGFPGTGHMDSSSVAIVNMPLERLFQIAIMNGSQSKKNNNQSYYFWAFNRLFWEVNDTSLTYLRSQVRYDIKTEADKDRWRKGLFCYHLKVAPDFGVVKKYDLMWSELNRYFRELFNIYAFVEKRKLKCWALTRTSMRDKIATRGGPENDNMNEGYYRIHNEPLSDLPYQMITRTMQNIDKPILDESGYTSKVDLDLDADLSNMGSINAALKKYDLAFIEVERELDVIVIKKIKADELNQ